MQEWGTYLLLFCVGTGTVIPTLWGSFVFDDGEAVVKNGVVTKPLEQPAFNAFSQDFWGVRISHPKSHKSYRPLTVLSFRLDHNLWGLNPFAFHLHNLIIHGLNCCLVYAFLKKCIALSMNGATLIFGKDSSLRKLAFWAAIIFAVHPIHVEPLGGVVGRADLMGAFVFLLGFVISDAWGVKGVLISLGLGILGSLFKETAITLPVFQMAFHFAVINRFRMTKGQLMEYVLCSALLAAFIFWRLWFQGGPPEFQPYDNPPVFSSTLFMKVSNITFIWGLNAFLLLNPVWLCYDWSGECIRLIETATDYRFVCTILFFCTILGILVKSTESKFVLSALLLYGITFLPSSNIIFTVGFVLAERNLYLPSIAFSLLIAHAILRQRHASKILGYVTLCFAARSVQRSSQWMDQSSLFRSSVLVCPRNAKIHYNLGTMYSEEGNISAAEKSYKTAIDIRPDYYQSMNNLGNLLRAVNLNEAENWLKKALDIKPDFSTAWMNLGIALSKKNRTESLYCYQQALKFRKKYPDCEYNMGNLLLDMGQTENALECWRRAVLLKPTHLQSWINSIILLEQEEKLEKAKVTAKKALEVLPLDHTLHFLFGNILGKLSDFENAESHFLTTIQTICGPHSKNLQCPAKYFSNLGVLYHRWGKFDKAKAAYEESLKIDPNSETVKNNLRMLNKK